jgi:hypothetical protein
MTAPVWRIGQLLNAVQSTFVGLLRVWSIPIVLLLSIASGYTTYYGMSFFITGWIALVITVAVQSIIVICTLELAGVHWRANVTRFLSIVASLVIALAVSISFSYFKFYEFSQRDQILLERHKNLVGEIVGYLNNLARRHAELIAAQQQKTDAAAAEAGQAYLGSHPSIPDHLRHKVGKGQFWSHYHETQQREQARLETLTRDLAALDGRVTELRGDLQAFSSRMDDPQAYDRLLAHFHAVQGGADALAASQAQIPVAAPTLPAYAEFRRGITPSFAMWEHISWFALACAAMVDFFTVLLSYRLEFTAPGPLTEEEKELAYAGLRQFGEFTINANDELEFSIEKTELERARRVPDWSRMFAVAFLLNRGYLRKIGARSVEFAPNLYPVIAERMKTRREAEAHAASANDDGLATVLERKRHA